MSRLLLVTLLVIILTSCGGNELPGADGYTVKAKVCECLDSINSTRPEFVGRPIYMGIQYCCSQFRTQLGIDEGKCNQVANTEIRNQLGIDPYSILTEQLATNFCPKLEPANNERD